MQKRIEQYLNRATRGLWGRKRQQVKQELYSHIYEKMHFQMSFGKSEEEALESTLQAMGKPREVNAGLFKLHALPAVGKMFLITGMLSAAVISQAQRQVQIPVLAESSGCTPQNCNLGLNDQIPVQNILDVLQKASIEASIQHIPQHPIDTLKIKWTDDPQVHEYPISDHNQVPSISLHDFLSSFSSKETFKIKGLLDPEITYQNIHLKLTAKNTNYDASGFYFNLLGPVIKTETGRFLVVFNDSYYREHPGISQTIRVPEAQDGEVFVLLQKPRQTIYTSAGAGQPYAFHITEAQNGKITFQHVQPTQSFAPPGAENDGDVLLKLSGEFKNRPYNVVFPEAKDLQP